VNRSIDTSLDCLQGILQYRFNDPALLDAALRHASAADQRSDSNERLEFLGDAVLGLVICQNLYERFPDAQEGELTKIKSAVVSRRICAEIALRLGLPDFLKLGKGMDSGDHLPRSLAAAVLEAIIAAVYLDGGFDAAQKLILEMFSEEIERAADSDHRFNYKSQLQQLAQRRLNSTPRYELLDEKGPDHSKCFEVAVSIGPNQFPGAWGPSKKEAEQKAAMMALLELGELSEDDIPGEAEVESV
jgi:ribonuclease-3